MSGQKREGTKGGKKKGEGNPGGWNRGSLGGKRDAEVVTKVNNAEIRTQENGVGGGMERQERTSGEMESRATFHKRYRKAPS